jgi:hypothetical protein
LVVLKDERRNLYQDVAGLFAHVQPQHGERRGRNCPWWDFPDLCSLPQQPAPIARIVAWGHRRWDIENFGFNELVNAWEADHIYKHEAKASEAFLLMAFLARNIFHAFLALNLKPQLRHTKPEKYWACLIAAELYRDAGTTTRKRPP